MTRKTKKTKLSFSHSNKIQSNFNDSRKIPSWSILYQIEYDCKQPKIYNGEIKVEIKKWMKQHFTLINDLDNKSEMFQHIKETVSPMFIWHWSCLCIAEQEKNWNKRRIKETIYSLINESINKHWQSYRNLESNFI